MVYRPWKAHDSNTQSALFANQSDSNRCVSVPPTQSAAVATANELTLAWTGSVRGRGMDYAY